MIRLLFALAALLVAVPAMADPADIDAAARGVVRVVIVEVDGEQVTPLSHGTGFAVGPERILTNAHVVLGAAQNDTLAIAVVPADGENAVLARVVAISQRNDLALLATSEPLRLPPLTIAGNPASSGAVTAIGYPRNVDLAQGLAMEDMFRAQPPVTATGFLSGRRPSREMDTLLHTAPIAAGNSGGPLVDECGRVIGINSFGTDSDASDAEFFFAVSTRELLPFLRENGVTPRLNSGDCRSLAELDAEERARRDAAAASAAARSADEQEAVDDRTEALRREAGYAVQDERDNHMALAFLLLLAAGGAAVAASYGQVKPDHRLRAIAGGVALAAVVGALAAWLTRPAYTEIDDRVTEALQGGSSSDGETMATTAAAGRYQCVLDPQRSRVTGDPEEDIAIDWREDGCVNGRTQYGLADERWTRIFVPAEEAAVSINRFDPSAGEFAIDRYLLPRAAMTEARTLRGSYTAPQCGAGEQAARQLGEAQRAITGKLPASPNERLVYTCTAQ